MRTGIGFDIHRLVPTIKQSTIQLGGISLPCYYKVQAHSDGDVLLHAITDACLGALALGDIGSWFPDTASENQDRPSSEFIKAVMQEVRKLGYRIKQVDTNVFLEEPKLLPVNVEIRSNLARMMGLELQDISLKAKTMEGLGPIGERRALAAQAIVILEEIT